MEKNELFETMPIKKAVMKMSIPLMTSLLVTVIYNMADTFCSLYFHFRKCCS